MNIFKIPKANGCQFTKIIGVIDASGSMTDNWGWLAKFWNEFIPEDAITITFDTITRVCEGSKLNPNIAKHGGGGTNIARAFTKFEEQLEQVPKDYDVTAIFISDGQDNNPGTFEKRFAKLKGNGSRPLNFICLGVGSGFPTFISMKLRQKYHKGDETLPAIFLIEYASEKAFLNKFESIKPFFGSNRKRLVKPPVLSLPWREYTTTVYENGWVATDSDKVDIDGEEIDISKYRNSLEGVVELFRSWTQMIHLDALENQEDVKDRALKTLAMMDDILEDIKEDKGVDLLKIEYMDAQEGLSFGQLAFNNYLKHTVVRAAWFYEDMKHLATGKTPKELSEFDAAKRIGIGTIVGKYHQKAFALKGFTVDDFLVIKNQFKEAYVNVKLNPNSNQEASVITLLNQKEVFLQDDFLKGLELCNTQFDLVEAFPVIGLAIKIKRFDGSRLNPWLTSVRFIAKHHKAIDSISILRSNNSLSLKTGDDKVETINAVLPLFDIEDKDLKPLLTSKLYHLLMTFNVVQNVDTLYEEAYMTLLANTFLYLLKQSESEWRDKLLKAIHDTCSIVYYDDQNFRKYQQGLIDAPELAIEKDEEQLKYGSIDLSKAIFHLFLLRQDKRISEEQVEKILGAITQKFVLRVMKDKDTKVETFLKSCTNISLIDSVKADVHQDFKQYRTKGDLRRGILKSLDKRIAKGVEKDYQWDPSNLHEYEAKVTLALIEGLYQNFLQRVPTKEQYVRYVVLGYTCNNLVDCLAHKDADIHALGAPVIEKVATKFNVGGAKQLPQYAELLKVLEPEFEAWFGDVHSEILPISEKALAKHCKDSKKDYKKYLWLKSSNLLRNACLAPKCPFYLQINDQLGHHLSIWEAALPPAFHKTVLENLKLDVEQIYEKFCSGVYSRSKKFKFNPDDYNTTKEDTLDYIRRVREAYLQIAKDS